MKINIPKNWVAAFAAVLFIGCATPQSQWKPAGYYVTDESIFGCDSYAGTKGTVMKKTAVLSLGLQRRLLGLLDHVASADNGLLKELDNTRDQLACWYETPEKNIELSLGAFCDSPFQIIFHPQSDGWSIVLASRAIVSCPTPR
jgi:hypothetical protein